MSTLGEGVGEAGDVRIVPARRPLLRFPAEAPLLAGVVAAIAFLAVVPLAYLGYRTFVEDGDLTLRAFREAYSADGLAGMLGNSLAFAAGAAALALVVGAGLAFLVVRTDVPARGLLVCCALVPLVVPGVLYTIAWIFLASPRSGSLNRLLEPIAGQGALDVFGMGGMIVVEGLHLAPIAFLLLAAAFRSMDASAEEAAFTSGARLPTVLRRVTLPLLRPALLGAALLMVVRSLESFEVPALVGIPGGVWVFTSRIWRTLGEYPLDLGKAGAYGLTLLALTGVGVLAVALLVRRGERFETITGRGRRPRRLTLGRWRLPVTVLAGAYVLVAAILPLLVLVYVSVQPVYRPLSLAGFRDATLASYRALFEDGDVLRALWNSILLAVGSATVVVLLMAVAAWLVVRTRVPGRRIVDGLAFLPLAVPGVVLGTALLAVYLRVPLPVYGTLWILFIAYLTRFMPYGMRSGAAAMAQLGRELEESARTCGARWWQTFRRITVPLVLPGLAAGWIAVVALSLRELSSSIVLYSPGNEVLSIVIWEQYEDGRFPELAALGVLMVVALGLLVALAYRLGRRSRLRIR
jgi:iron(III) transport system permease protein